VDISWFALHGTELLAGWTRLLAPQRGSSLLQEFLDRSLGHGTGRRRAYLLDVVSVEI
jgi:hypothetical protein